MDRRNFLWQSGGGLGGIALATMLAESGEANDGIELGSGSALDALHHAPKAKRVIQLFMSGAASHLDMWDHKPYLEKHHGEKSDFGEKVELFQNGHGPWMKSPWTFRSYGECGKKLSDTVAKIEKITPPLAIWPI